MRIAILDCNTDDSPLARQFPDDGQKVAMALQPWRPSWDLQVWPAKRGRLPPDETGYHGWLLTGSVASVRDGAPWMRALQALLLRLHGRQVPMVGLCFGHQLLAQTLGGQVGKSAGGWRFGLVQQQLQQALPWMQPAQATLALHAAHEEQVLVPPPGAQVLGGDAFAPVGLMSLGRHVFSTQYHPELSRAFMHAVLAQWGHEWSPALVAQAGLQLADADEPPDAARFMRWVAQFFEQGQAA